MDWNWYLFSFEGRINRAKFWLSLPILLGWMLLVMWIMWLVLVSTVLHQAQSQVHGQETINVSLGMDEIIALLGGAFRLSLSLRDVISLIGNLIGMAVIMWICLATSVKRLHDRDRSGWWIVPFFVLPGFSSYIPDWLREGTFSFPVGLALFILCIWGFIELGFLKGTCSINQFGPNPLGKQQMRPRSAVTGLHSATTWDQHGEIELVPHLGSPPPGMRVKRGA
jgi:uncharacterized membrane protein YhaH (DUF805 family)